MAFGLNNLGKDSASTLVDGFLYRFDEFALDSRKRTLSRADTPVSLTPKAFDVLLFLVKNPNRLVTKEELLRAVWSDTFVEEGNLTRYISHLRKGLGENSEDTRLIVTIARKGYQFTGDVTIAEAAHTAKQGAVQISTTETSLAGTQPSFRIPADEVVTKAPRRWRKAALVIASAILMVVGALASWRYLGHKPPTGSQKIMLAVMPFENLTGDPQKDYLADGLTEEMVSQLSRLNPQQLGVIARTSVMAYKHRYERLDQIGRDLSVQYVLESSLRESGGRLRLTAQLIQVKDQSHLWSHDYDYPAKDILKVEEDVARAVAYEIQLHLTSQQQAGFAQTPPVNPEAFDAYLRGYYSFERNTSKDTDMAAKYYDRATQIDPSYALAWVGLSRARNWQAVIGLIPAEEGHRLAREAVERALALNPNLAAAHAQMGRIKRQVDFDWAGADASIQRAIALEPGSADFVRSAALTAVILGRFDESLRLSHRAVDLDPLNGGSWESLAETELFIGQLDVAVVDIKKALALNNDIWNGHFYLSEIYIMQGRPQDALPEIAGLQDQRLRLYLYALTYHALGREKESDDALKELIAKYQAIDSYLIAVVYAFRNESDKAFEWLDKAYTKHHDGLIGTKVDPLLKSLYSDPRFAAFLKKLNLPT